MMATLKLTPYVAGQRCTDIDMTNGRARLIDGVEEKAQRIRIKLQTQLGSCVYRKGGGTPYREIIFARDSTPASVSAAIRAVVRTVTGIRDVLECGAQLEELEGGRQVARVAGIAIDSDGALIPFGTEVQQ